MDLPLFKIACHSSSLRWSGYVMFEEEDFEPKRAPRKGIVGIDERKVREEMDAPRAAV